MENSDTDSDATDKDTDGTGSAEVFDVHIEDPGVRVEGEMETDVSFKVCNVNSFAVSTTDSSLLFNLHNKTDKCTCIKYVVLHITDYQHVSITFAIISRVALQEYYKYNKLPN
jgi:PP-loop superfamily ATP-utilizing enzyme